MRGIEVVATAQRQQREHKIVVEVALTSRGFWTDKDVRIWVD